MAVDEYGREPEIIDGTRPNNPKLRQRLFGPSVTPRPVYDPANLPAFTNDQPQE